MGSDTTSENIAHSSTLDRTLRILHLEDSEDDRFLIQQRIKGQNLDVRFFDVNNELAFVHTLENSDIDLVLADKSIPGFDGSEALRITREKFPDLPFIFVTGSIGEDSAVETIRDGATDYVLKDRLTRLVPAVQRAYRESEQKRRQRMAEEKIRLQASLLDKSQDAILVTDMDDRIQYWNKSAERIYGWPAAEVMHHKALEILGADPAAYQAAKAELFRIGKFQGELIKANRGGNRIIVETHWSLVQNGPGMPDTVFAIDTDITEKKSIEAKFLRSQRMDSLGALAGGIAHDLNNALAPVLMGAELLGCCDDKEDRQRFLEIITANTQRATQLVKQILSFARGSGNRKEQVNVRSLITEMKKMMQETFPKSISVSARAGDKDLWQVQGDSTEIHQVLMNLCVNARDAMSSGGRLIVSAENFIQGEQQAAASHTAPGPYVVISVADTGPGIPAHVIPRIFEPFFTTKAPGKGTGLGLSTVSSIIKSHGGFLDLHTEPGKGTEFKAYFPALIADDKNSSGVKNHSLPTGQGELILIIDDEETLLELTKAMLESCGYRGITAPNGPQGIARFREHQNEIRLVITDSDMPFMSGGDTIQAINELAPELPFIMASGTKCDTETFHRFLINRVKTLAKPYTLDQLLTVVNAALHHPDAAPAPELAAESA
jgi:hypothetical protein